MKNKYISFFADSIVSGILLCIGCAVNLSVNSPIAGAFLFSLGLFAIISLKLGLYTGKAGYMAMRPLSYVGEVIITLFGNIVGASIGGGLLSLTKLGKSICSGAAQIVLTKSFDSPLSIAVMAFFCGILMFIAVEGNRRETEKGNFIGALFVMVMPVMVFILCGFNHSIADFSYFFISRCAYAYKFIPYVVIVIFGNACGCMLIPIIKKLSINPL